MEVRWRVFVDELEKVKVDLPRSKSLQFRALSHPPFPGFVFLDLDVYFRFSREKEDISESMRNVNIAVARMAFCTSQRSANRYNTEDSN